MLPKTVKRKTLLKALYFTLKQKNQWGLRFAECPLNCLFYFLSSICLEHSWTHMNSQRVTENMKQLSLRTRVILSTELVLLYAVLIFFFFKKNQLQSIEIDKRTFALVLIGWCKTLLVCACFKTLNSALAFARRGIVQMLLYTSFCHWRDVPWLWL